jgi:hypothetical protein
MKRFVRPYGLAMVKALFAVRNVRDQAARENARLCNAPLDSPALCIEITVLNEVY